LCQKLCQTSKCAAITYGRAAGTISLTVRNRIVPSASSISLGVLNKTLRGTDWAWISRRGRSRIESDTPTTGLDNFRNCWGWDSDARRGSPRIDAQW